MNLALKIISMMQKRMVKIYEVMVNIDLRENVEDLQRMVKIYQRMVKIFERTMYERIAKMYIAKMAVTQWQFLRMFLQV